MKTITLSLTNTEENFNLIAVKKGYQTKIKNPDYVPAVGSPQMVDPEWEQPEDFDEIMGEYPMVDNPDYVAEVGEPFMDNPETPMEFLAKKHQGYIIEDSIKVLEQVREEQEREANMKRKQETEQALNAAMSFTIK